MGLKSKVQSLRSKVRTPKGGCGADRGPTPNIQHPTSNIQHPTANSQNPTWNPEPRSSNPERADKAAPKRKQKAKNMNGSLNGSAIDSPGGRLKSAATVYPLFVQRLAEPGIEIWPPSNDLAQSRR